ncbi:MAG: hypothetical protein ACI87E_003059 [Mariniblastus sp.]|jgi:hypothetical protein
MRTKTFNQTLLASALLAILLLAPISQTQAQKIGIEAGTMLVVESKIAPAGEQPQTVYNLYEVADGFQMAVYGESFTVRDANLLKEFSVSATELNTVPKSSPGNKMEIHKMNAKTLDFDGQDIGMTAGAVYVFKGKMQTNGNETKYVIPEYGCQRYEPTEEQSFQYSRGIAWAATQSSKIKVKTGSIIAMEVRISEGRVYKTTWNFYEASSDFQLSVPIKGKTVDNTDRLNTLARQASHLNTLQKHARGRQKELPAIHTPILNSNGDDVGITAGNVYVLQGNWQESGGQTEFKISAKGCQQFELDEKQAFQFSRGITWNGEVQ